jgi:1-acyl-sn-glycerol-3-phosphate acyltransferase
MLFDNQFKNEFADIRCYDDTEVLSVLDTLRDHGEHLFSLISQSTLDLGTLFTKAKVSEVQKWLSDNIAPEVISKTTDGIDVIGIDQLDKNNNYIFVSNHRDIAMDPLVINIALLQNDFETAHNAIGENLLVSPISKALAGLNKCFQVNRTQRSPKAMLKALKHQSNYISAIYHRYGANVWIAQREGRSIDNSDLTNPALLKMLSLAADPNERNEALTTFRIVPVAISYEWDPCDHSKARRLAFERGLLNPSSNVRTHNKSMQDYNDVVSGLSGWKGKISVHFGQPIKSTAEEGAGTLFKEYAKKIDRFLHSNYQAYPNSFAACKLLGLQFKEALAKSRGISSQQILDSERLILKRLEDYKAKYGYAEKDKVLQIMLELYAANIKHLSS